MSALIGRSVHFYPATGERRDAYSEGPYAGIVTAIREDVEAGPDHVDLVTFGPGSSMHFEELVAFIDPDVVEGSRGAACWTWPQRFGGGGPK